MANKNLARLRIEVQGWLDLNVPADLEGLAPAAGLTPAHKERLLQLRRRLGAKGWLAPSWPVYFGGAGLNRAAAVVVQEELDRRKFPRLPIDMPWLVALRVWGTEEQKGLWLTRTLRGGITVVHNIGETRGTSDLATRRTTAVRDGDQYILNGEEWYIPSRFPPDYLLLLVVTDPGAPRYLNMSAIIVDAQGAGVYARVRRTLVRTGDTNYMLDDARVPVSRRIGPEGQGWWVAQTILQVERGEPGVGPDLQREIEEREREVWTRPPA